MKITTEAIAQKIAHDAQINSLFQSGGTINIKKEKYTGAKLKENPTGKEIDAMKGTLSLFARKGKDIDGDYWQLWGFFE